MAVTPVTIHCDSGTTLQSDELQCFTRETIWGCNLAISTVRAHITTLERDGIVEQRGSRRGTSKPAFAYDLTPAAEQLFPKAHGPVLAQLLTVLA